MRSKTGNTPETELSRRKFLGAGLALSAGALALPAHAFPAVHTPAIRAAGNATSSTSSSAPDFELEEITVAQLQDAMASGKWTARSIAEKYLARIAEIDTQGPALNSVIELNPEALAIADSLDAERKSKGPRGPMHGIPVLIKDNIGTSDRMMTSAGSLALSGNIPPKDSGVARQLRAAGAVILGKTNLSEWANFRSSHSSSGWSGRGGQTRNPYALDRNPCGSSSGSGAAVSANLCAVTVGSETDGSIVCPSSANGVVGIKPTVGLVSRAGIVPISHSQDTAGPICRTVADAAALLTALAGEDPDDSASAASRGKISADYTKFLDRSGLRGARIGVVRKFFDMSEKLSPLMDSALDAMKREGAVLVDPVEIDSVGKFDEAELEVMYYEFKADLNAYLSKYAPSARVHSLADIIAFNEQNHARELQFFGQDIMTKSQAKGPLTEKAYIDAREKSLRLAGKEGIDAAMDLHKLDALLAPTAGPAWVTDLVNGDHDSGGSSSLAAVAGYPNINVPAGFIFGLPVGISFFGRAWSEPALIKIAYAFEQATRARQTPKFLGSADLYAGA
ncbi:MAG: amidase [Candidatus Acidiferrales bacterium]